MSLNRFKARAVGFEPETRPRESGTCRYPRRRVGVAVVWDGEFAFHTHTRSCAGQKRARRGARQREAREREWRETRSRGDGAGGRFRSGYGEVRVSFRAACPQRAAKVRYGRGDAGSRRRQLLPRLLAMVCGATLIWYGRLDTEKEGKAEGPRVFGGGRAQFDSGDRLACADGRACVEEGLILLSRGARGAAAGTSAPPEQNTPDSRRRSLSPCSTLAHPI